MASIDEWCQNNSMSLNAKKTKCMLFGTKNCIKKHKNVEIKLKDEKLHFVPSFKYLGFTLDSSLTYNQHINITKRNTCHKLYQLKRINPYLTEETSVMIYKSYILPIIEYGNIIYANATQKNLKKLQTLQNQALKTCLNANKFTSTNTIHKTANLNTLEDRRNKATIKFMFKRTKNEKFIDQPTYNITTRMNNVPKLKVPTFRSEVAKKSLIYRGSILWNNLDYNLKEILDYKQFTNKVNTIFKNKITNDN